MSLDSDSDLQAYINELSRKTQDWQYADEESALDAVSTPSLSSVEIDVDKREGEKSGPSAPKQAKSDFIQKLEAKYLKKVPRSVIEDISTSLSENDLEIEKENVNVHWSEPDRNLTNKERKIHPKESVTEASGINESLSEKDKHISDKKDKHISDRTSLSEEKIELGKTQSHEEKLKDKSPFHASSQSTKFRRRSSDASLLINKSGIFYSSSLSTDKPDNLSNSDSKSSSADSVPEEIPELERDETPKPRRSGKISRQESVLYSVKESPEISHREEHEVSLQYGEEDTFESTDITSEKNKTSQSEQESGEEESISSESSEEEKTVKSSKAEKTAESSEKIHVLDQSTESRKSTARTSSASSKDISSHDSRKNLKSDQEISNASSLSPDKSDTESQIKKSSKRRRDKKTGKTKTKSSTQRRKRPPASPSSASSAESLIESLSSSSSTSFSIKMKHKKYEKKKRKLKREKEMTELIIKTMVKNLPLILRYTGGLNLGHTAETGARSVCCNCGGVPVASVGWEATNRRIDEALRQTVNLTRQFLDAQKTMLETEYRLRNSDFKYTRLKNYSLG